MTTKLNKTELTEDALDVLHLCDDGMPTRFLSRQEREIAKWLSRKGYIVVEMTKDVQPAAMYVTTKLGREFI